MNSVSIMEFAHAEVVCMLSFLRMYVDDTGDYSDERCDSFGMVGLVGAVHDWHKLQAKWEDALECCGVTRFHATDLQALEQDYEGWTKAQRERLVSLLVRVVQESMAAFHLIGGGIPLSDYRFLPQYRKDCLDGEYSLCAMWAMLQAVWKSKEELDSKPIEFIFDQRMKQVEALNIAYDQVSHMHPRMCLALTRGDHKKVSPIQVADLVAYESKKYLESKLGIRPLNELRWPVQQLEELFFGSKAAVFTYDILMLISDHKWGNYEKARDILGVRTVRPDNAETHIGSSQRTKGQTGR